MENTSINNKLKGIYYFGLLTGSLFLIFGVVQFLVCLGLMFYGSNILFIPGDIIGGFIQILTGIIFLYGIYEINKGVDEGVAFIYVGMVFSLFFMGIYLLVLLIDLSQAQILNNPDYNTWSPAQNLGPGIYLASMSLIAIFKWREKFSIKRISS